MSPTTLPAARRQTGITGAHVLWSMIAFFGVIFAVNGVLLTKALSTHSGVVAVEPYRKGLDYNRRIAADECQELLGWSAAVTLDGGGRLVLEVKEADGRAVDGLVVSATVGRPSTARHDRHVRLDGGAGRWVAQAGPLEPGAWLVTVEATPAAGHSGSEPLFRIKRRLWLTP